MFEGKTVIANLVTLDQSKNVQWDSNPSFQASFQESRPKVSAEI